ncbi:26S proteasome regulatory subunit N1 [Nematocida sp. AWRm80]|nr:26S proteasome regulatory subunit N1 [Nematocida sp. AWRm80]
MNSKVGEIHLILDNLKNSDPGIHKSALSLLVKMLMDSSGVLSDLKTLLQCLISEMEVLKEQMNNLDGENRKMLADVLSVISASNNSTDCLRYRMLGGSTEMNKWGHEYVQKMATAIITEHTKEYKQENTIELTGDIEVVINETVKWLFGFYLEIDAVDMLLEVNQLHKILPYIDTDNTDRVSIYLTSIRLYLKGERKEEITEILIQLYKKANRTIEYITELIQGKRLNEIKQILDEESPGVQMQIGYILFKHSVWMECSNPKVQDIINGKHMAEINRYVSEILELTHTEKSKGLGTLPEAFTKASFANEMLPEPENKKTYKISSQAAKGLLYLWDQKAALNELEEHLFSEDGYLRASSILGLATSTCRLIDTNETVLAAAREALDTHSTTQKLVLIQALALQYTATNRKDIFEILKPFLLDEQTEVAMIAIYAAGSIFASSCNQEVFTEIMQVLIEREATSVLGKFALLGVALIYLGGGNQISNVMDLVESLEVSGVALGILLKGLAYFGQGEPKILQEMLQDSLNERSPGASDEEEVSEVIEHKQVFAILGVALMSVGDDLMVQMATQLLEGSLLLDIPRVQMAIPLALSLLHMSTAKIEVIETLKRSAHSGDTSVMVSSIGALGIVAAGSNNSRVQAALEQMGTFCGKGAPGSALKLAEGLVRLGKGTMKLSMHTSGIPSPKSIAGILGYVFSLLDAGMGILDRYYFVLMLISPAIAPKHLVTVNEAGTPIRSNVRVGTRIDVSGVAGRPKQLSGTQMHETPVILQSTESAEVLADKTIYHTADNIIVIPSSQ